MKHTQWLRLQAEGDRIVASFRADGFNCRKQPRHLSWHISKDSVTYRLTWLPAPINEWSLLPNDGKPQRERLLAIIHSILEHRGCGRTAEPSPKSNHSFWHQQHYPWTLVRLLPNAQNYTVARFYSRTEAENHQGDRIVASFRADGFNCCKQPRRLSWHISKDSITYRLTWLPALINEWMRSHSPPQNTRSHTLSQFCSIAVATADELIRLNRYRQVSLLLIILLAS